MASKRRIVLPVSLKAQIEEESRRGVPEEICGFLIGVEEAQNFRVESLRPIPNRDSSNPRRRFAGAREDYEEAEARASRRKHSILGVYHSHPESAPEPSEIDAEFAFPGWVYWITSLAASERPGSRAWLRGENGQGWEELEIKAS